jgi:hypothetical protein
MMKRAGLADACVCLCCSPVSPVLVVHDREARNSHASYLSILEGSKRETAYLTAARSMLSTGSLTRAGVPREGCADGALPPAATG